MIKSMSVSFPGLMTIDYDNVSEIDRAIELFYEIEGVFRNAPIPGGTVEVECMVDLLTHNEDDKSRPGTVTILWDKKEEILSINVRYD